MRTFLTLGLLIAATVAADAQSARRIVIDVPFDFVVRQKKLPAGEYTIYLASRDNDKMLLVRGADGSAAEMIITSAIEGEPRGAAKVAFHRYGDQYFLAQVWPSGTGAGRALHKSALERSIIREITQGTSKLDAGKLASLRSVVTVEGRVE
jgi:hypothetical protein